MAGGERGADTHAPRLLRGHVGPWGPYAPRADQLAVGEPKWVRTRQFGSVAAISRPVVTKEVSTNRSVLGDRDRRVPIPANRAGVNRVLVPLERADEPSPLLGFFIWQDRTALAPTTGLALSAALDFGRRGRDRGARRGQGSRRRKRV